MIAPYTEKYLPAWFLTGNDDLVMEGHNVLHEELSAGRPDLYVNLGNTNLLAPGLVALEFHDSPGELLSPNLIASHDRLQALCAPQAHVYTTVKMNINLATRSNDMFAAPPKSLALLRPTLRWTTSFFHQVKNTLR